MFDIKIKESSNTLRVCSSEFIKFYKNNSLKNANIVSEEALKCFDFIVNEILRFRDDHRENVNFRNSDFQRSLGEDCGEMYQPANVTERQSIITTPILPNPNSDICFEKLITKFKHREKRNMNFRIEADNSHIIIFSVKEFYSTPASIVEFDVQDFCQKAENVAKYI